MNRFRRSILLVVLTLPTAHAAAAGTYVGGSIVPSPTSCASEAQCGDAGCQHDGGACATNADCHVCNTPSRNACASNADCALPAASSKSKVQLFGTGRLKVSIKGFRNTDGSLITTDGIIGTADDYLLVMGLSTISASGQPTSIKLDFKNGKAAVDADVSALISGSLAVVTSAALMTPPPVADSCPGTNTPADIDARKNDEDCLTGTILGRLGLVVED